MLSHNDVMLNTDLPLNDGQSHTVTVVFNSDVISFQVHFNHFNIGIYFMHNCDLYVIPDTILFHQGALVLVFLLSLVLKAWDGSRM